jgi:DNA-binding MarR family transcriptional regulator/GNAT superfamily N-acetyltransferase
MTLRTEAANEAIAAVRRFNRFYTRQIGLLDEKLLASEFNLTEARILYELAHQPKPQTPTQLSHELLIDPGYLSRILKSFEARGLIARYASPDDGRQTLLSLTKAGREAFDPLDRASQSEVKAVMKMLTPADIDQLLQSMQMIERLLGGQGSPAQVPDRSFMLRSHQAGDLDWIAHRQSVLYTREYGWDGSYEVLAREILAEFEKNFDQRRERSWIAVRAEEIIGSVFVTKGSDTVAKLRLLYVEPAARGTGLGRHLVDTCIAFAREKGYRTLSLWTNDVLVPARRIYQAAGFSCVDAKPHHSFGKDLVGEIWELSL